MVERKKETEETQETREFSEEPGATAVTKEGSGAWAPAPAPVERRFEPGTVLAERYRVVSRLGKGGMGEVYLADDLKLEQQVALKFLPPEVETDAYRLRLLFDEVKVALGGEGGITKGGADRRARGREESGGLLLE